MNIGIIGAGTAGLTAAWLLDERHAVTVFEKDNRLGGHAHTVDVQVDGETVAVDAGVDFFNQRLWPTFCRLLDLLGVPVYRYAGTTTLYTKDNRHTYTMPLIRDGKVEWSVFRPSTLSNLLQFQKALSAGKKLVDAQDTSLTIEEFARRLHVDPNFIDGFLHPFLQSLWCIEKPEYKTFAAYNGFKYLVLCDAGRFSQFHFSEVVGGTRTYIDALAKSLKRTRIQTSTELKSVGRVGDRYVVEDGCGGRHEFDHLIIATGAREAATLVSDMDATGVLRRELAKFQYFTGTIAVHGDKRLMPRDRRHWSVFNIRHDTAHSALTVWKKWKIRTPVFKSWITYESHPPEPLYFMASYQHPKVTPQYFEAQKSLANFQGLHNLWFAGLYTHDIDSHESAIQSAVRIAGRLEPHSSNLKRLHR
jgi:predicted NAD/FAD-binding protein